MMDGNGRASTDSPSGLQTQTTQDDDTIATPPRGENDRASTDKKHEKTLKFRFPPMNTDDMIAPSFVHARWMCILQEEFGDAVQFFDNKNQIIPRLDPIRMDQQLVKAYFLWHSQAPKHGPPPPPQARSTDRRFTRYMLHRMRTSCSLSAIKANPKVRAFLKEHNFYVNEHRWNETEWDITQLGFFFGTDPSFYNVDQATEKITAAIQKAMTGKKFPKFKLVFTSPKVTNGKKSYSTKAYAIESQRTTSQEMIAILKTVFKSTGEFVPYQMRRKHPDAFLKLVRAQTQVLAKNRIIHLNHIGSEAMYYMSDHINAVPGVQALLPTKHADLGQYKVSVAEKDFQRIRMHLKKYIQPWYDQFVEPDARNPESKFPGPPIVASIEADDYSEDEQSYMTVSVNTALSLVTVLSDETIPDAPAGIPKTVTQHRNWADVASDSSQTSRTTAKPTQKEPDQTTSDLISALSTSQAQVDLLKEQVAELRAEREETAKTIAEAVKQQVEQILMTRAPTTNEDHITGQQFTQFVQTQDRKIDALTSLFTQMMTAQQQFYQTPHQQPSHHSRDATTEAGSKGPSLGKRNAVDDLETVDSVDRMETDDQDHSRKRSDYRATPQKTPLSPTTRATANNNVEPRQLLAQLSPRQVPIPESPPHDRPPEPPPTPEPTEKATQAPVHPSKPSQPTNYQQQSMSRYLSEPTSTNISNPPQVVRITTGVPEEVNQASLSDAEDASQVQGSGNAESETSATPTSNNRRRGSNRERS